MKPAVFKYIAPRSLQEAFEAVRRFGSDGKILAGGQSLVPLMAMRLARPATIIDLNRIPDLAYIRAARGGLSIGAMTRQRTAETHRLVIERFPLLADALQWVGHAQIRTRGTIGGSLAHADPSAELPAVAAVLGGRFVVASTRGERIVDVSQFFTGYLATALQPHEILVEVQLPAPPAGAGWAFQEIARRHGDFAIAGVAVLLRLDGDRRCSEARLAFTGVGPGPVRASDAETYLAGKRLGNATVEEAGRIAQAALDPDSDIHASAAYRKHVAGVLAARALRQAAERAKSQR